MEKKKKSATRAPARAKKTVSRTVRKPARPRHARKSSFFKSVYVFWSTGIFGAAMIAAAVLASSRMPVEPAPVERSPAAQVSAPVHPSPELAQAFDEASAMPLGERVAWWSRRLWKSRDATGELASLGRGPEINDIAPLLPNEFDCTTFVETVAALSLSEKPQQFFERLIGIRYRDARPGYLTRNHFPEADWIPNNVRSGNIVDITEQVARKAGVASRVAQKTIDRGRWLAEKSSEAPGLARAIASDSGEFRKWSEPVRASVTYIPIDQAERAFDLIPSGSIINFLHENDAKRPVLVTHQGIVVREGGVVLVRHASPGGHVRTSVLGDYLRENARLIGINLNQLGDVRRSSI